ncbi:MAG: hypothetical protein INR62_00025 [Rhodospirillales bacterium]|nr:hypothetical protein [Acetobacter sp.]
MKFKGFHLSTTTLCVVLLALFHLGIWWLPPPTAPMEGSPIPARDHWPRLRLQDKDWRVDTEALRKSILRLPSTVFLRQACNSLRLSFREFPAWMFYSHHRDPTYFLTNEMPLAAGLTPSNRQVVERAAAVIADFDRHFREEQWKMVVLPVPTKLTIYRQDADWPLGGPDQLTLQSIPEDRTDEVCDLLFALLAREGVAAVDLRKPYREIVSANNGQFVFPPGETHWSGLGLKIAADRVADALAALGLPEMASSASWVPYRLSPDIDSGLDHFAFWPPALRRLSRFQEGVERGRKPDPGPDGLRALVALSGTSYTGQYSWLGNAGLAASLDCRLPDAIIRSYAEAGRGSLQTVQSFVEQKTALLQEMAADNGSKHHLTYDQKYFVWEFPVRDIRGFLAPPHWIASGNVPLVRSDLTTTVAFADGFHQEEVTEATPFRWARQKAALHVHAAEAGRYRMTLHPVTRFSTAETTIAVTVNGRFVGVVSTHSPDFRNAVAQSMDMTLSAGDNLVVLESDRDEVQFGPGDLRAAAYALVLPVTVEPVP